MWLRLWVYFQHERNVPVLKHLPCRMYIFAAKNKKTVWRMKAVKGKDRAKGYMCTNAVCSKISFPIIGKQENLRFFRIAPPPVSYISPPQFLIGWTGLSQLFYYFLPAICESFYVIERCTSRGQLRFTRYRFAWSTKAAYCNNFASELHLSPPAHEYGNYWTVEGIL